MIPIHIDVSDIQNQFQLSQQDVDDMKELAVKRIATDFQQQWKSVAGRELKQTREMYKNSIRITYRDKFTAMVYLDPSIWIVNAMEMGYASFDMKTGFLSSDKVKFSKDGDPYLTIPFRFATPGAIADSPVFSGRLPSSIHSKAKSLKGSPVKMGDIPEKYHIPKSHELRNKIREISSLQESERTSIYEGVRKSEGGYINFRRVSLASHADSWIHPGFDEMNLAEKAMTQFKDKIPQIISDSIDDFLDQIQF